MHSLDRNKLVVNGTFTFDQQGRQADDYILISGTFGEATWLRKQDYVPDKDFDHYVGEHFGGGIVTSVWLENGVETCLVVSTRDLSYANYNFFSDSYYAEKRHAYTGPSTLTSYANATYSSFGASNSSLVAAQPNHATTGNDRGAVQFSLDYVNVDLGSGVFNDWYLPSITELMTLADNLSTVNRALYDLSLDIGTTFIYDLGDGTGLYPAFIDLFRTSLDQSYNGYWSSTEVSANTALCLDVSHLSGVKTFMPAAINKNNLRRVRPFRIAKDGYVPPVKNLTWSLWENVSSTTGCTETFPGSGIPSGWKISNDFRTVRFDVSRSATPGTCPLPLGTCNIQQRGFATASIVVKSSNVWLTLDFEGMGELVSNNFDKIKFRLDGVLVASANAPGGNGDQCLDGPVIKTFFDINGLNGTTPSATSTNPYKYFLAANTSHVFSVEFDTVDALYHRNSYYQANIDFVFQP